MIIGLVITITWLLMFHDLPKILDFPSPWARLDWLFQHSTWLSVAPWQAVEELWAQGGPPRFFSGATWWQTPATFLPFGGFWIVGWCSTLCKTMFKNHQKPRNAWCSTLFMFKPGNGKMIPPRLAGAWNQPVTLYWHILAVGRVDRVDWKPWQKSRLAWALCENPSPTACTAQYHRDVPVELWTLWYFWV